MDYFLGIDPGRKGGMALIDEHRNLIYVEPMPFLGSGYDYERIAGMISHLPPRTGILLELKPGVMETSASPTSSLTFHCGVLYGLCLGQQTEVVSPKAWKTEFNLTRNYKESRHDMKLRTLKMAEHLFKKSLKTTEDGLAEALLLAEYGRRHRL